MQDAGKYVAVYFKRRRDNWIRASNSLAFQYLQHNFAIVTGRSTLIDCKELIF